MSKTRMWRTDKFSAFKTDMHIAIERELVIDIVVSDWSTMVVYLQNGWFQ